MDTMLVLFVLWLNAIGDRVAIAGGLISVENIPKFIWVFEKKRYPKMDGL